MHVTRSITQKLTIAADSNIDIKFEADGTICLTMISLTGEGTHTKWYHPEMATLKGKERGVGMAGSGAGDESKVFASSQPVISPHGARSGLEAMCTAEQVWDEWDADAGSDTIELVSEEETERGAWLKVSREDGSLQDLPYERIMRRISQEPTIIEDEYDVSSGTEASWSL